MSTESLSVAEAKATFSEQVRSAELGDPVVITRHGKPVAALVPAHDLDALLRLRSQGPEGGLASVAGGWEGSEELVEILQASPRIGRRATVALDWSSVAFLFDTDAISELLRPQPLPIYLEWIRTIPREDQFTSAVCIGELFKGAYRSPARDRHLMNIEQRVLPAVTVLPYDLATARVFGELRAKLEEERRVLADADSQIAATALHHGLELVTGNVRHFQRIRGLRIHPVLSSARQKRSQ
jgi:prevent-host-death family protein